jgi:hypothetical protein
VSKTSAILTAVGTITVLGLIALFTAFGTVPQSEIGFQFTAPMGR